MIKNLILTLLFIAIAYAAFVGYRFRQTQHLFPAGSTAANVDIGGLTLVETGEQIINAYNKPIVLYNNDVGENVELTPDMVSFAIDLQPMLLDLETKRASVPWKEALIGQILGVPVRPISTDLVATHDADELRGVVEAVSELIARPPQPPRVDPETSRFLEGQGGYLPDVETTAENIEAILYEITDDEARSAEYVLNYEAESEFNFSVLGRVLEEQLQTYRSLVGSVYIKNLDTGEEININGDLAMSGLSIVKIAIITEAYRRAIDTNPTFEQQKLINGTAIQSGNFSAGILLDEVAGYNNAYDGVDIVTESMQQLGLENTFIATPYGEPARPTRRTVETPANSDPDLVTDPDPSMQTTAVDMGTLLTMLYDCANHNSGTLLVVYPDTLNPDECQATLDVLSLNVEGNLIRFGVPNGVKVSHKHGWAGNTHGDAGIVYSDGADYVVVTYLNEPGSDWLSHETSFPILREMSRITYNYFNIDDPYLGNALEEADRFDEDDEYFNDTDTEEETETETETETGEEVDAN